MTTKDLIVQELDQVPESRLDEILEFVRCLKAKHAVQPQQSDFWQAYLASKQEREEEYPSSCRLLDLFPYLKSSRSIPIKLLVLAVLMALEMKAC